jgi:hypothetical protein|nr:hypothetical protein [Candidatus Nitrospira inopinata]
MQERVTLLGEVVKRAADHFWVKVLQKPSAMGKVAVRVFLRPTWSLDNTVQADEFSD